jgi:hypothetical protein
MYILSPHFLASYWSAGFGTFLQVSALASQWLEDCANLRQLREKTTNVAPTTLSAIQAISQSTFINAKSLERLNNFKKCPRPLI